MKWYELLVLILIFLVSIGFICYFGYIVITMISAIPWGGTVSNHYI